MGVFQWTSFCFSAVMFSPAYNANRSKLMPPVLMSLSMHLFVRLLIDSAHERLSAQCGTHLKMNCGSGWVLLHSYGKNIFSLKHSC